jgi:hypothetical protein
MSLRRHCVYTLSKILIVKMDCVCRLIPQNRGYKKGTRMRRSEAYMRKECE